MGKVKTGDIVFFRTKFSWKSPMSWLSVAIRWAARIKYNHVGVVVENWGQPFINEALANGIVSQPYSTRVKGKQIMVVRPKRPIEEEAYAKEANCLLGIPYDVKGLIWDQLIFQITGKWSGQGEHEAKDRLYCYEYAALMNKEDYPDWWKVDPKSFLNGNWHYEIKQPKR